MYLQSVRLERSEWSNLQLGHQSAKRVVVVAVSNWPNCPSGNAIRRSSFMVSLHRRYLVVYTVFSKRSSYRTIRAL